MNGDEIVRAQLREQLLDQVPLPPDASREMMFARTFASSPGTGADLLPPDDLFDSHEEDGAPVGDAVDPTAASHEPSLHGGDGGHDGSTTFEDGPSSHDAAHQGAEDWYGHEHRAPEPGDHADPGHGASADPDGSHGGAAPDGTGW